MSLKSEIMEFDQDILFADNFDDALIGIANRFGMPGVACYDYEKCIDILMQDDMTYDEAVEFFEFNVIGAWVGEYTPVFVRCVC